MKKKLLLVLMLIAAVVVMPRVYAEDTLNIEIGDNTQSDTLQSGTAEVTTEGDVTTITYNDATFKLLDGTNGRTDNKAWIGFKITLPTTGINKYTLKNEKSTTNVVTDGQVHGETDNVVNVYVNFDKATLTEAAAAAKNIEYTYILTITPSTPSSEGETITKTIKVVVVPKGIVLQSKESTEGNPKYEWTEEEYKESVKKVTVTVKVMKDGKEVTLEEPLSYELPATYAIGEEELAKIKAALTTEDVELVGLYTEEALENKFDETAELTDNVTVYVAYKTKTPVVEEPAPNTLDNAVMYIALAGVSLLVAGGVAVYFKRFN